MASHDTDPDAIFTSAKKEPTGLVIPPAVQAQMNRIVIALVVAGLAAVWAKVDSCRAVDTASDAQMDSEAATRLGVIVATVAREAKRTTDAAYDETREKVNPLGEDVKKLREDLNVLLEERATRLQRIKARTGRKPEVVAPKPVSPAGGEPLPADPTSTPNAPPATPATPGGP